MKAAPVLAGIFQGPQEPIPTPIEPIVGLTYRAASTVGTAA
jgi:hypothetical protein